MVEPVCSVVVLVCGGLVPVRGGMVPVCGVVCGGVCVLKWYRRVSIVIVFQHYSGRSEKHSRMIISLGM